MIFRAAKRLFDIKISKKNKSYFELIFWKNEISRYLEWYDGKIKLYGEKSPLQKQKIKTYSKTHSAILTWGKIHQQKKYLNDLKLNINSFKDKKVLDIGSGPYPSAIAFNNAKIYCLDPLISKYIDIGFPIHYFDTAKFVQASSENIPFPSKYFDAIISVNALDHVDNLGQTVSEIRRVIKPKGKIRLHVHYHARTPEEPIELNDKIMLNLFRWCDGFKKISDSNKKTGTKLKNLKEKYTLWSN